MSNPSAVPRVSDSIQLNKALQQYMMLRSHQQDQEAEPFATGANRTDVLIMEVMKGLIASAKA